MGQSNAVPVHESLMVYEVTRLYRTDEWWKAVVTYRFDGADTDETAVYLWHNDDEDDTWTRKNKYVIKTPDAWATDRAIIDGFVRGDPPAGETDTFPVSDYYTVAAGETVFQNEGWWKAIVNVVAKGSYETDEVMVYVWQQREGSWRRRQKYTIKSLSDWEEERGIIDDHVGFDGGDGDGTSATAASGTEATSSSSGSDTALSSGPSDAMSPEFSELDDELDAHLSEEFR